MDENDNKEYDVHKDDDLLLLVFRVIWQFKWSTLLHAFPWISLVISALVTHAIVAAVLGKDIICVDVDIHLKLLINLIN
jgi:hypothetical protein